MKNGSRLWNTISILGILIVIFIFYYEHQALRSFETRNYSERFLLRGDEHSRNITAVDSLTISHPDIQKSGHIDTAYSYNPNRSYNISESDQYRVPVYYATDRKVTHDSDLDKYYNSERSPKSSCNLGIAYVSIPLIHRVGHLESPPFYKFWGRKDTTKYIVITDLSELNDKDFYSSLREKIQSSSDSDALIFIHGYNTTFADAIMRTAQLAFDLGFKGAPISYSWPSQGSFLGYIADEANVEWTVPHLKSFIHGVIEKTRVRKINIIAHSMGNRALSKLLIGLGSDDRIKINQVILAAPDVDADVFKTDIAPNIIEKYKRVTIYSSDKDIALKASETVHSHIVPLGEAGQHIFLMNGIDNIDASELNSGDFFSHAYFSESRPVIDDISLLIQYNASPGARNLLARDNSLGRFWVFKK